MKKSRRKEKDRASNDMCSNYNSKPGIYLFIFKFKIVTEVGGNVSKNLTLHIQLNCCTQKIK